MSCPLLQQHIYHAHFHIILLNKNYPHPMIHQKHSHSSNAHPFSLYSMTVVSMVFPILRSLCKIHCLLIILFWTLLFKFNICFVIFSHIYFVQSYLYELVIDTFQTLCVISNRQCYVSKTAKELFKLFLFYICQSFTQLT